MAALAVAGEAPLGGFTCEVIADPAADPAAARGSVVDFAQAMVTDGLVDGYIIVVNDGP